MHAETRRTAEDLLALINKRRDALLLHRPKIEKNPMIIGPLIQYTSIFCKGRRRKKKKECKKLRFPLARDSSLLSIEIDSC